MFTNDQASCDHNIISIIIEQEEIQQFDVNLEELALKKVYDNIQLTEPIMIECDVCKLHLNYDDIIIEEFIAKPLLDGEQIDILSFITKEKKEETDGDECSHEQISLELYQRVKLELIKDKEMTYKIKESILGEKELYLTCDMCSTILYEFLDAELQAINDNTSDNDDYEDVDEDIFILDDDEDDDHNPEDESFKTI